MPSPSRLIEHLWRIRKGLLDHFGCVLFIQSLNYTGIVAMSKIMHLQGHFLSEFSSVYF